MDGEAGHVPAFFVRGITGWWWKWLAKYLA